MPEHITSIKVRYAETDRMGVVYYANYLVYFEVARTELLRALGVSYRDMEETDGIYLMVAESNVKYISPLTYDDDISVHTTLGFVKNASLSFNYRIYREGKLAAEGMTVHVCTNRSRRPVRLPDRVRTCLES